MQKLLIPLSLSLFCLACSNPCAPLEHRIIYRYSEDGVDHTECKSVSGAQCDNCNYCHEEHYIIHSKEEAARFKDNIIMPTDGIFNKDVFPTMPGAVRNPMRSNDQQALYDKFWDQVDFEHENAIIVFAGYRIGTSYAFSMDEVCSDRIHISLVSCSVAGEGSSSSVGVFVVPKGEYEIEYRERTIEDCEAWRQFGPIL